MNDSDRRATERPVVTRSSAGLAETWTGRVFEEGTPVRLGNHDSTLFLDDVPGGAPA